MLGQSKHLGRVSYARLWDEIVSLELATFPCERPDDMLYFVGPRIWHGSSSRPLDHGGSKSTTDNNI